MITAIDEALRTLVRAEALDGARDIEVVLDAPTKDWAARRNAPTVNLYLYDLREDMRRRAVGHREVRTEDGAISRIGPPRHFKMSYLVTAWTQRPEDEHRLLSSLLTCFLRYDALPAHVVPPTYPENGLVVPITVGLPPPEDRTFADVWSALGGELKPSLDLVVIAPIAAGIDEEAGPPVREGMLVDMADLVDGGSDHRRQKHEIADAGQQTLTLTPGKARARKKASG